MSWPSVRTYQSGLSSSPPSLPHSTLVGCRPPDALAGVSASVLGCLYALFSSSSSLFGCGLGPSGVAYLELNTADFASAGLIFFFVVRFLPGSVTVLSAYESSYLLTRLKEYFTLWRFHSCKGCLLFPCL